MTSKEARTALDGLRERLAEVQRQHAARSGELESTREALARATAHGDDRAASLRAQARDLAEEVESLARAVPLLEDEIETAQEALQAATADEAEAAADAAVERALAAVEAVHGALRVALDEGLARLIDEAEAATHAAWALERRSAKVGGTRQPSASRVLTVGWYRHPGLRDLARALRDQYQAEAGSAKSGRTA